MHNLVTDVDNYREANMFIVELNEQQYKYLFFLLDRELKAEGMNALANVVDIHNALLVAQRKEEVLAPNEESKE